MSWFEPAEMLKCRVEELALAYSANNNFRKGVFIARMLWGIVFRLDRASCGRVHLSERPFPFRLKGSFALAYLASPYGMNEHTSDFIISPKATTVFQGNIKRLLLSQNILSSQPHGRDNLSEEHLRLNLIGLTTIAQTGGLL